VDEHNVLAMMQRLDDIFVRCGHGKYGLMDWGIPQDRTIADAAYRILQQTGEPIIMRQLTERVLEQRHVQGTSVQTMVSLDPRFCRFGPKIGLREWAKEDQKVEGSLAPATPVTVDPQDADLEQLLDLLLND
jgi:hypothetical protein